MKKTSSRSRKKARSNGLRAEYDFDYSRSRTNRFASRLGPQTVAVVLAPDVAQVFASSRAVNKLLRSIIAATPTTDQTHVALAEKRANTGLEPTALDSSVHVATSSRRGSGRVR